MGLLDMFNKGKKVDAKELERDNLRNYIESLNIKNTNVFNIDDDFQNIQGLYKSKNTDGKILMSTITKGAMQGFFDALAWCLYESNTRSFNDWYSTSLGMYITKINVLTVNEVNEIVNKLLSIDNTLGAFLISKFNTIAGDKEPLYDFFYKCLAMDIINGRVIDTYSLCGNVYNSSNCYRIIKNFPIHENAKSADSDSLNIAVAYWITFNTLYQENMNLNTIRKEIYFYLLSHLDYSDVKMIDKEETIVYAGVDKRLFDFSNGKIIKDMCNSNTEAVRFRNMIEYININNLHKSDFIRVLPNDVNVKLVLSCNEYALHNIL